MVWWLLAVDVLVAMVAVDGYGCGRWDAVFDVVANGEMKWRNGEKRIRTRIEVVCSFAAVAIAEGDTSNVDHQRCRRLAAHSHDHHMIVNILASIILMLIITVQLKEASQNPHLSVKARGIHYHFAFRPPQSPEGISLESSMFW